MAEWFFFNNLSYIIHLFVIIGFIGFLLTFIAKRIIYAKILMPIFFIILLLGVYCEGVLYNKQNHIRAIAGLQKKLDIAIEKSNHVNEVIKTVYVDKIRVIKEKGEENVKYIETVITKYDNLCTLSNAAIKLHDSASQNEMARSAPGTNEGTSDVKISEFLRTVTENYGSYYQTREQLIGWQQWYNEQKKIFESIK